MACASEDKAFFAAVHGKAPRERNGDAALLRVAEHGHLDVAKYLADERSAAIDAKAAKVFLTSFLESIDDSITRLGITLTTSRSRLSPFLPWLSWRQSLFPFFSLLSCDGLQLLLSGDLLQLSRVGGARVGEE